MLFRSAVLMTAVCCWQIVTTCSVSEHHVTLGDMFSIDGGSDHAFTLTSVFEDCDEFPAYTLICGEEKPKRIESIMVKQIDLNIGGTPYKKKSLSALVFKEHSICKWQLVFKNKILTGPYSLPSRALDNSKPLSMAIIADMDLTDNSKETVARLMELQEQDFDLLMHIGDFAYEIEDDGGQKGDDFFQQMSKVTRYIPYIVTPGNHENFANGSLFNYRFRMPNTGNNPTNNRQNHLYDLFIKGVYLITLNFDYILQLRPDDFIESLNWVEDRLKSIQNNPDVRWKVFFSHRPIMCNDLMFTRDCSANLYILKAFDDLFIKYNLTIVLNGHLHIYSRLHPLHNFKIMPFDNTGNGTYLQIISGHSGTEHYFPGSNVTDLYDYPFVDKIDLSGPTYMSVQVSRDYFDGKLLLSIDDSVLDDFSFKCPKSRKIPHWVYPLIIGLAVVFFLLVVWMMVHYLRKMSDADQKLRNELEIKLIPEHKGQSVGLDDLEN